MKAYIDRMKVKEMNQIEISIKNEKLVLNIKKEEELLKEFN
jgi:hypothetical protein